MRTANRRARIKHLPRSLSYLLGCYRLPGFALKKMRSSNRPSSWRCLRPTPWQSWLPPILMHVRDNRRFRPQFSPFVTKPAAHESHLHESRIRTLGALTLVHPSGHRQQTTIGRRQIVNGNTLQQTITANTQPMRRKADAAQRSNRLKSVLRLLGPGLITGAANDDPSAIGTYA